MGRPENRIAEFHRLHSAGCFVMPNPWDAGSARALEQLGFKALATTSAGLAWTLGRADTQVTRDQVLDHLRLIVGAVTVPVNADFEGGYAVEPADVAANVSMAAETGIAGLSIEHASGDEAHPLFDFDLAVHRVAADEEPSTRAAPTSFSPDAPRVSCVVVLTSMRPFAGSLPMPRQARTASTLLGSSSSSTSRRSWPRCHRNR